MILINAVNLTGAGARTIGLNLFPRLAESLGESEVRFLLPDDPAFRALPLPSRCGVDFTPRPTGLKNDLRRMWELYRGIPGLSRKLHARAVVTFGDLPPIRPGAPQVLFLNQALLVYEKSELMGLSAWSPLKQAYLRGHLRRQIRFVERVIVQTPVMADRVERAFGVPRSALRVIPQPVPEHVAASLESGPPHPQMAACSRPTRLLFLSRYYPHKNHQILPALTEELRRRGLAGSVRIFTTLAAGELPAALEMTLRDCRDVVENLGVLHGGEVAAALKASSALFLPTLAESFGLVYLEAMSAGCPPLTSDRDFAHWICGDCALYFDPFRPESIASVIVDLPRLAADPAWRLRASDRVKAAVVDWSQTAQRFAEVIHEVL